MLAVAARGKRTAAEQPTQGRGLFSQSSAPLLHEAAVLMVAASAEHRRFMVASRAEMRS
jgi:hypothetical protein